MRAVGPSVLPSVRLRAGLPTSASGARSALALPRCLGRDLGPPPSLASGPARFLRIPRDFTPDLARPPPCPSFFLPPFLLSLGPCLERPSLAYAVALARTRFSISFLL